MPDLRQSNSLSWGDALFLYLERPGMPLNVASVLVFEGIVPPLEDCIAYVESKIPLIPRYRQRVVAPPFNIGLPTWEFDPEFDVRNHLREITLKYGTDTELKTAAAKILGTTLDRNRPLWDLTLVRGLKGNRTGLIARLHHCLADGIAGVGLMNIVLDASPIVHPLRKKKPRFRVPPLRDSGTLFVDGIMSSYFSLVQGALKTQSEVLELIQHIIATPRDWSTDELIRFAPEIAAPTERLPFNLTCGGSQKIAWGEFPLREMEAIRTVLGGTLNDVILSLVTMVVRDYAELHRVRIKGRLLRIMVPVNLRGNGKTSDLGNRISIVPVTIPLDIRHPRKLIAAVHARTRFIKHAHVAELVGLAGSLLGTISTAAQALAGPVVSQLPITPFNLVCTNVPGPQAPLYFLGQKMLSWYPWVPVGGEMAVNCAILSYNGTAYFGFSGYANAAPDLAQFEKLLKTSYTELRNAAGLKLPRRRRERTRAKITSMPKPSSTPISQASPVPGAQALAAAGD